MRLNTRWLLIGLLLVGAVLVYQSDFAQTMTLASIKARQAELEAWRRASPWLAGLMFFLGYAAAAAISLPGAALMTVAAGAIFGLGWGTLIVSFASSLGATLAFLSSRWLLGPWVNARFGTRMATLNEGVARDGGFYLFTLRLVPVLPFFAINLGMGLTAMRPWTFYWVSQVGMLAATLVYVNAGTQLASLKSLGDVLSPTMLGSLVLLGFFPWLAKGLAIGLAGLLRAHKVYARWPRPGHFDRNLIVIGGGSAGLVTAYIAAALKARVTLVEKHALGGDCLNTGCVPSKALIRSAKFVHQIRRAKDFGIHAAEVKYDFAEVMERVQRVIKAIEPHDSVERYTALGVEVAQGVARVISPWQVEINHRDGRVERLTTRALVIAAGARPFVPPIPGIERVQVLTSDNVWRLRVLPRRLLVLGGGPIGCELAQAFARLGSKVTQVEMADRILSREDAEVSETVTQRFESEGVTVLTGHEAQRIDLEGDDKFLVAIHRNEHVRIPFDELLVAVGRQANLAGYGLESLGVSVGRTVDVNGYLQTNFPNIYAAGDVAGPYQFTHTAAHQAWYAAVNALFSPFKKFRADYSVIPAATFVEPEVARVGLNELEAKARGTPYEVTCYGLDDLDRAIADGVDHGFIKVLTVPGKDRILGATIVGEHAGDLLAEFVLAMKHGIGLNQLLATIHIYPTLAEANKYLAGNWKRAHAPQGVLRGLARFHRWRLG
jgi:pyruvate/2-oxoglutarate dehydrogenase complex dihydrolipoamide dehydrogenase (E3) component/uncharacterized membrane protein YdjX (TVP38/TMEM64 family)